MPVVPDSDDFDSDDLDDFAPFFAAFFDDLALFFEVPDVEPVSEPVSEPVEPDIDDSEPDDPLEPIEPDEPVAEDFFDDALFLWCFACFDFAVEPLVPVSLLVVLPFVSLLEPCMPLLLEPPMLP